MPQRCRNKTQVSVSIAVGSVSLACGAIALVGWYCNLGWLTALSSKHVSMKANAALGFVIAGAILVLATRHQSSATSTVRYVLEGGLLLLGILTLFQYIFNIDLYLNQLFIKALENSPYTTSPGRMAPSAALGFIFFSFAMLFDHCPSRRGRLYSRLCATLVLILAVICTLGYLYDAPSLYLGIDGLTAMSLPSAVLFTTLAIAVVWLRGDYGFPALIQEKSMLGTYVRTLVPMIVVVPIIVGAIVALGYGHLYEGEFAVALTVLGSIGAAAVIGYFSVKAMQNSNAALYLRDRALAATTNGILITDSLVENEPVVYANEAFTHITGYSPNDAIGKNGRFLNEGLPRDDGVMTMIRHCLDTGTGGTFEILNRKKNGDTFWNRLNLAPIENHHGVVTNFVGVIDDISWRHEQEDLVREALDQAQTANTLKDSFVRLVSHELRTPLNSALTWVRFMELDRRPEMHKKGLAIIAQSIETQSRLIDDLVDINRFQTDGVRLESVKVDLHELISTTLEELRPQIEPTKSIDLQIKPGNYIANADPVRMQQIIRNLVTNADKYTEAGDLIRVKLKKFKGYYEIEVEDTGQGLSDNDLPHIFKPFWRAENDFSRGLGIGLSITSALVAAHQGQIKAFSNGLKQGTRFTVTIPSDASLKNRVHLSSARDT